MCNRTNLMQRGLLTSRTKPLRSIGVWGCVSLADTRQAYAPSPFEYRDQRYPNVEVKRLEEGRA